MTISAVELPGIRGGAFALLTALLVGCGSDTAATNAKTAPKVVVTHPITDTVLDYQDFTGRLEAVKTVEIRSRVSGYVTEIPFKEGALVKQGDLLFQIDPRPYQADYDQADANLKLAVADRQYQEKNTERVRRLIASRSSSRDDLDAAVAALDKAGASVEAGGAAKDRAKLYLGYTHVTAPVSGRISRRYVDPSNLVVADNTVLTTIVTEDPMFAYFDVDERTYLELLSAHTGEGAWSEGMKIPVLLRLSSEKEFKKIGQVDFVDNRVVATTGTVRMRGVFPNDKGLLKSGLFVRIRLPIGQPYKTLMIPDEAIQSDQERKYVWVVDRAKKVHYRSVKIGPSLGELRVIRPAEKGKEGKEGLADTDQIIIGGMQRARNGITVDPEMHAPPAAPDQPLVRLLTQKKTAEAK